MDEFSIIRTYFAPLAKDFPGALNLRDDAALIDAPPGKQLVLTKDAICEGVHFLGSEDPALIARKLLRVNLSDLAAKGARPYCYLLAVALTRGTSPEFIARFAQGLAQDQSEFTIHLAGGDSVTTAGPNLFTLTAVGLVPYGQMLTRKGAQAGDLLFCSGTLGDGALGLMAAQGKLTSAALAERYSLPQPRLALGKALRGIANSAIDVSDGLVQDAGHIVAASNVGVEIMSASLPLSPVAQEVLAKQPELFKLVLAGGDDYELLFTAPPDKRGDVMLAAKQAGVAVSEIGRVVSGNSVHVLDEHGVDITPSKTGYSHF